MHFVASLSSLKNELLFCKVNDSSVSSADKISTFSGEIVLLAPNKLHDWRWRVALLFWSEHRARAVTRQTSSSIPNSIVFQSSIPPEGVGHYYTGLTKWEWLHKVSTFVYNKCGLDMGHRDTLTRVLRAHFVQILASVRINGCTHSATALFTYPYTSDNLSLMGWHENWEPNINVLLLSKGIFLAFSLVSELVFGLGAGYAVAKRGSSCAVSRTCVVTDH